MFCLMFLSCAEQSSIYNYEKIKEVSVSLEDVLGGLGLRIDSWKPTGIKVLLCAIISERMSDTVFLFIYVIVLKYSLNLYKRCFFTVD